MARVSAEALASGRTGAWSPARRLAAAQSATAALVAGLALGAAALSLHLTRFGLGLTDDSLVYFVGAEQLRDGHGLSLPAAYGPDLPITAFPPLYSVLLVGLAGLAPTVGDAARWLAAAAYAINVLVLAFVVWRACEGALLAPAAVALAASVAPELLTAHAWAWSEPPFYAFLLLGLYAVAQAVGRRSMAWTVLAAGLLGLAGLQRFAGLLAVGAGAVALLLLARETPARRRVGMAAVLVMLGSAPPIAWMARSVAVGQTAAARRTLGVHPPDGDQIEQAIATLAEWAGLTGEPAATVRLAGLVACALAVAIAGWRLGPAGDSSTGRAVPGRVVIAVLAIFGGIYAAALPPYITFLDASIELDLRTLSPLLLVAVVGTAWLVQRAGSRPGAPGWHRWLAGAGSAVVLAGLALQGFRLVQRADGREYGYGGNAWQRSPIFGMVAALPEHSPIVTNVPELVMLYSGRGASDLPQRRDAVTARENPDYHEEMRALRAQLLATDGSVVYFRIEVHPRRHLAQEAEVQELLGLEMVDRTGKGSVYRPIP